MVHSDDFLLEDISEEEFIDLAELFKIFGDSTRIKILFLLFKGEANVSAICDELSMNQSAVSHQLKILRTSKLVKARRAGKAMYYSLADDHVKSILSMGKEHIEED
ncbi:MAG: metalloregulator ArsR/SmtB family transcription factor [Lachnospiraceae bacterium]|nr:metalloregulator ArsR/SmtB family transcription factor [Lachnospiraceae bacterium]